MWFIDKRPWAKYATVSLNKLFQWHLQHCSMGIRWGEFGTRVQWALLQQSSIRHSNNICCYERWFAEHGRWSKLGKNAKGSSRLQLPDESSNSLLGLSPSCVPKLETLWHNDSRTLLYKSGSSAAIQAPQWLKLSCCRSSSWPSSISE